MTHTLTFHSCPSHSYLEVPHALMKQVKPKGISHCSYRDAENAYLEEDADAGRFLKAAKEKGVAVEIREVVQGDTMYERIGQMRRYS